MSETRNGPSRSTGPSAMARIFPEQRIVRFNRRQGAFVFFSMVADLLKPNDVVVDFGAGRGNQAEAAGLVGSLSGFKGRCARAIGVDVDPAVLENPYVDDSHLIGADGRTPLPADCADIVFSYAVLEHVADPAAFVAEIHRILKPGGWFCAWTPNKWGYVALGARLIPNRYHARLIKAVEPGGREAHDVFPTVYRMNTRSAIRGSFGRAGFEDFSFTYNGHPSYNFGRAWIARLWMAVMALSPPAMRQSLFVFVRKPNPAKHAVT